MICSIPFNQPSYLKAKLNSWEKLAFLDAAKRREATDFLWQCLKPKGMVEILGKLWTMYGNLWKYGSCFLDYMGLW